MKPPMHVPRPRGGLGTRGADERRLNQTTEEAIGCAFRAANVPGCGFLEKVYEKALAIELKKAGLNVEQQAPIKVW